MTKTLIAKWNPDQDPTVDRPDSIRWDNGMPATLEDYARHLIDTNASDYGEDGTLAMTMYPDVVADVRYDRSISCWVCHGPDRKMILELDDPDVADDQIIAEMSTHPVFYRAVIHRARMR
jgi:hypothetical protein